MPLYVARRNQRKALYLPMGGAEKNLSLMFYLPEKEGRQIGTSQLDELIRSQLEKVGITRESDVQDIVDKAERDYELRIKVEETKKEIRRLMDIRAKGGKLMRTGDKKWGQTFYPSK